MIPRLYTRSEEIGNTISHAIGCMISAFLFGVLACLTFNTEPYSLYKTISCCVFGISSMFMFIMSSMYHAVVDIDIKRTLKLFDHIAIYFLIAGTYIPVALTTIIPTHPILGWSFVITQILAIIGGICYKLFSKHNYSIISVLIYCILGWSAIFILPPLISNMPAYALTWLVAGGLAYTFGVPFYVLKQYMWTHTVWHIFVVLGIICHYMMMLNI